MIGKLQKRLPIVTDDPIELSTRVIDTGEHDEMVNRVTQKLSVLDDDIAIVESFSHIIGFRTEDGLVCFDASGQLTGEAALDALRRWTDAPIDSLVYTHGHVDHVGGSGAMAADAERRGHRPIRVVGHAAVAERFDRYRLTSGYNTDINMRQFGGVGGVKDMAIGDVPSFLPEDVLWPEVEIGAAGTLEVGGTTFEMRHAKGETDDHLWTWIPEHRALCVGDFVTWVFPNCGNPQKVQRYPLEWAAALREMITYDAEWLFGAHGLPVRGADRIATVLGDLATALELLTEETLAMMNAGEALDDIVHQVTVPDELLVKPWMQPVYDEPEFVVRNLWRLYGGWWDKNPANLKPAPQSAFASEMAALAGGADALVARATELAAAGELRLACQVIELAVQADPDSVAAHGARAEIYSQRRSAEFGLMSKGVYAAAARESKAIVDSDPPQIA
ncbi:MAG: alkyl sulfatase dimerization domain-containing protein [Actinomycetota bacterium]